MRAYIAVSYSKRKLVDKEITLIIETLNTFDISSFVFVDKYKFNTSQEKQMMLQVMKDIENCDILIAETSEKGIGIGIEVGYAKAKGKILIYLRHQNAEHSTTVSGISDFQIIYSNNKDLQIKLMNIASQLN
jgi:nucleoside 2-deoxyribosyltransferase